MDKRDVESIYLLTPMQQGMLFRTLDAPGTGIYVEQASYRLAGEVDLEALKAAWDEAVRRHPVLRTGFFWEGREEPLQVVFRRAPIDILSEDWRAMPAAEQAAELGRRLAEDRAQGFDLSRPPLLRLLLFRLDDRRYQLVWSHHHIILDGWSVANLLRQVLASYAGGRGALSAPTGTPFSDYVAWLGQRDDGAAERFWRRALADLGAGSTLELEPDPSAPEGPPREIHRDLPAAATRALLGGARAIGVSLATVVQGALALLLSRWTSRRRVVFGLTVSGRPDALPGIADAVGLFINTLPLAVTVDEDRSAGAYLHQLQDLASEAMQHGHLPLPRLQAWSDVPAEQPFFETLLVVENYPRPEASEHGLDLAIEDFRLYERTDYPLTFVVVPGERLRITAVYDPRRIRSPLAKRLTGHLERLLVGLADDPARPLGGLEMLTEGECRQILSARDSAELAEDISLGARFRARVAEDPDAPALTDGGRVSTYGELAAEVSRLARRLVAAGVAPGEIIGVCLEPSSDLVVALLAVLEAGAAYLPLDPAYPEERLALMIVDSGTRRVIGRGIRTEDLGSGISVLDLDLERTAIAAESAEPLGERAGRRSLAYVLYTSGSTGRPKGVMVEHGHILRLFRAAEGRFDFGPEDVWTLFHSYAFDFSVWELWGALLYGGRLVVVPHPVRRTAELFHQLLVEEGVTVLNQTPSAFRQLIRADAERAAAGGPLALRWVIFGGEALDPRMLAPWMERHPRRPRLVNMYGITETTVHVTWRRLSAADLGAASVLGEPLADLETHVLDPRGRLLPAGAAGEIYVGGGGVARGYLARTGLTARRFLPDPFGHRPGGRLYRTGDRARLRENGELEFLGRVDQQIKIRGFRIEPGEVEAAVASHPAVAEAVVIADDDPSGEGQRLLAYWLAAPAAVDATDTPGDLLASLRTHLRRLLPDHMIPAHLLAIDRVPLTANGKLDRRALPRPEERAGAADARPPRTPLEEAMAEIWAEVLGLPQVGVDDGFFDLGGHSLIATRLVARMRRVFQVDLPVRAVLEFPTVAELAEEVQRSLGESAAVVDSPTVPLAPVPRDRPLPLSFGQERLWLLDRLSPGDPAFNIQAVLRLEGALDVAVLSAAFGVVVRRHEVLRTVFETSTGKPCQRVQPPSSPPLPVVDLTALRAVTRERRVRGLTTAAGRRAFDLAQGPLLRLLLLREGSEDHVLHLALHHTVGDGWSMGVLVRDVVTAYRALAEGRPVELPGLPVQFADFAVWQRQVLSGERLERQLDHWRRVLGGPAPRLSLPVSQRRSERPTFAGAALPVVVPAALSGRLRDLTRRCGATLFMTLLAAFEALLWRITGESDVRVGTPIAGRQRLETEGLVGLFLNTLMIRVDFADDPGFRELLSRVRAAVLDAFAHQEVPYELVMWALEPIHDAGRPRTPQVLFLMQNFPLPSIEVPGIRIRALVPERLAAQSDLALELEERDGVLRGLLAYNVNLFEASVIERLAAQLVALLEEIVDEPDRPLSEMTLGQRAEPVAVAGRFTRDLESW